MLNIIQKTPETVFHLEVDEEQWRTTTKRRNQSQVGRERANTCQSATTRVLHDPNFKLVNESLANGLK